MRRRLNAIGMRDRAGAVSFPVRSLQVLLTCLLGIGASESAAADKPAVFSPAPPQGQTPYFSIALPPGWKMAGDRRNQENSATQRSVVFTFAPADAASPHLFVKVDNCRLINCEKRRERAQLAEHRRFQSGGESSTDYFDSGRNILWQRSENARSSYTGATFFGAHIVNVKFFHDTGEHAKYSSTIQKIIDHLRVYQPDEVATEYSVDAELFAAAGDTTWYKIMMWTFPLLLVVLFVVERRIARRRIREDIEKIDADIAERKARSRKPAAHADATEDYLQKTMASRRKRQSESA